MRHRILYTLASLAAPLVAALWLTVPGDYGQYASTFGSGGFPAFVGMPSVFITHVWVAASAMGMAASALPRAPRSGLADKAKALRSAATFVAAGGAMYVVGVWGISRCVGFGGPVTALLLAVALVLPGLLLLAAGWLALLAGQRVPS